MTYYEKEKQGTPSTETWKCSQCSRELNGIRLSRSTALPRGKEASSVSLDIQSKCPRCGNVMCGSCLELQKPDENFPTRDLPCPDCGTKFGDDMVLVPEQWAQSLDAAGVGLDAMTYVKDLKGWAKWLVFWSILNTFVILGILSESPDYAILWQLSILVGLTVLVSAIICLASRAPWPGFYVIFSLYLIMIGLMNIFSGSGFWVALGILQVIAAAAVIGKGTKYASSRTDSREVY